MVARQGQRRVGLQSKRRGSEAQVPASKGIRGLGEPLPGEDSEGPTLAGGTVPRVWDVCVGFLGLLYKVPQTGCLKAAEMYGLPPSGNTTSVSAATPPLKPAGRPFLASHSLC